MFQPAAFGAGEIVACIVGAVLSKLTIRDVVEVFPALSVAVPDIVWLAPSEVTVRG